MKSNNFFSEDKKLEILIALAFLLIGVILRFFSYLPNFSPITAIALFGGAHFSKKMSLILPISILIVSDFFIGYYQFGLMISVYLSFFIVVILGFQLKKNKKLHNIVGYIVFASLVFFIITNFGVWLFTSWYPKTLLGFIECYLMAIPFFKNTLIGNLFFVSILFGLYEIAFIFIKSKIYRTEYSW